jgi:nucleoside-diphosphate-sugar epimerase
LRRMLVTGGSGFIGQNLIASALDAGWSVTSLDCSEFDGFPHPHLTCHVGDITHYADVIKAMKECSAVVHLAAQVSVQESIQNPEETMRINVEGTQKVLDAATQLGVKKIIVASSAAVYGNAIDLPLGEESAGECISPYAVSKWLNEEQVMEARQQGSDAVALRFFNVYGLGQSVKSVYGAVIPTFVECMTEKKKPSVFGDGSATRDFVHATDVASAILKLFDADTFSRQEYVYNVATGHEISLLRLIQIINEILLEKGVLQKAITPDFQPKRHGDVVKSYASIERITQAMNWAPEINFEDGVREMIDASLSKRQVD